MSKKRNRVIDMPAPYLRRVWLDPAEITDRDAYPFCLPFLRDEFELKFDRPITIIVGENGTGKSTLLEGIAVLPGFDDAGGGKGYGPVDHSDAKEVMGGELSEALRASWLPKITNGWFFRAESFLLGRALPRQVNRDSGSGLTGLPVPLAWRGLHAFLRGAMPEAGPLHLRRTGIRAVAGAADGVSETDAPHGAIHDCQVVMATHSPMLMAYPSARLLRLTKYGLEPVSVEQTDHYKVMREFCNDPTGFVEAVIDEWTPRRRDVDRF